MNHDLREKDTLNFRFATRCFAGYFKWKQVSQKNNNYLQTSSDLDENHGFILLPFAPFFPVGSSSPLPMVISTCHHHSSLDTRWKSKWVSGCNHNSPISGDYFNNSHSSLLLLKICLYSWINSSQKKPNHHQLTKLIVVLFSSAALCTNRKTLQKVVKLSI